MLNITVNEEYNENNMVEMNLDGIELGEREMGERELYMAIEDAREGRVKIRFEDTVEVRTLLLQECDGEYEVQLNTWTFKSLDDSEIHEEVIKTYKTEKGGLNRMNKEAEKLGIFQEVSNC